MKRKIRLFLALLAIGIVLPGLIYLVLALYYQQSFPYGTWINGIYCTGKTVDQVQEELTEAFSYQGLRIYGKKSEDFLSGEAIGLTYDFRPALRLYLEEQNPFLWIMQAVTGHKQHTLTPKITFSEKALEQWIYTTDFYQENQDLSADTLSFILTETGYQLLEQKQAILSLPQAKQKIEQALITAQRYLSLEEENCYFQRKDTSQMAKLRNLYRQIDTFQNRSITYRIKDQTRKLTAYELASLLMKEGNTPDFLLDRNGNLQLNLSAVEALVQNLAKEYDTWHNLPFITHDGRSLQLTKGNYGVQIDQKKEVQFLLSLLQNEQSTPSIRVPSYLKEITYKNQHGIGDTYIEIDLGKQKLYYFSKNKLVLETEVVTGCVAKGMATPEMVCYVYHKREDAILRGADYRTSVDYWMPVYKGIGIHDASWRREFGGEIYYQNGSHGCINTPFSIVSQLYHMVEIGTPVVIHH